MAERADRGLWPEGQAEHEQLLAAWAEAARARLPNSPESDNPPPAT